MMQAFLETCLEPERAARACSAAFAHLDDAVFVIGRKPRTIVACNRAAEVMFGYEAKELAGRDTSILHVDHEHFEEFARRGDRDLERTGCFRTRFRMRRRSGAVFDTAHMVVLLEPDHGIGAGALSIVRDLSDVSRALGALEETQRLLIDAQRGEAAGRLQSMAAHDLNNLLTAALGSLHLLLGSPLSGSQQRHARTAREATARAASQIRRLLAFARPAGEERLADPDEVLGELEEVIRAALGKPVDYRFEAGAGPGRVAMNAMQLEQIVLNLVMNAREAMPFGGRLRVRTARAGDEVAISVADTGEGIAADLRERIFEPFYTTRGDRGGSGLGLAAVRILVERSGGRIEVADTPGGGTTFTLHLPVAGPSGSHGG